jgi:4'-phosphopantetheinyl transferase
MTFTPSPWRPETIPTTLPDSTGGVWRVPLDPPAAVIERAAGLLSQEEQEQAARFRFPGGRRRFTAAHAALRLVLERLVGLPARELRLRCSPYGKPDLDLPPGAPDVRFNLSHSGEVALVAAALGRTVGVDVERIRTKFAGEAVARRFFSPAEVDALLLLPDAQRVQGFFNCWTRKEAYVKAHGQGISLGLSTFEVSLAPGAPPALTACHTNPSETGRWAVFDLPVGAGYAGALFIERPCQAWLGWEFTWNAVGG